MIAFLDPRLPPRFWAKVTPCPMSGCWLWTAAATHGYGRYGTGGRVVGAHRFAFEVLVGPAPGLDLDHLCRTPCCVNPRHLEPVTHRENVLRGVSLSADEARRTHCPAGHPYDDANTGRRRNRPGSRYCRACARAWATRRRNAGP